MRKRYKNKKYSCKLCKPHKMGLSNRWKNKELAERKEFESVGASHDTLQRIY